MRDLSLQEISTVSAAAALADKTVNDITLGDAATFAGAYLAAHHIGGVASSHISNLVGATAATTVGMIVGCIGGFLGVKKALEYVPLVTDLV